MIDVTVSAMVAQPSAVVSDFLFDPRNDPRWIGGLVEVYPPEGALAVGVQVSRVASFMGRRIDYVLEVDRIEPGHILAMRSVAAPFPMDVTYTIESEGGAARVSLRVEGGPGGWMRLMAPVMSWQVRRNLRQDLRRLRACLGDGG
jgi:hypothetical protein